MTMILSKATLCQAVDRWLAAGKCVVGPTWVRPGLLLYAPLGSADQLATEGFVRPTNSIKTMVFPRHETLFTFAGTGRQVRLKAAPLPTTEQIVVAARPCDAAALPILDHLFLDQQPDPLYSERRRRLSVVTLACQEHDEDCFCTSVGLGPSNQRGSDAMLYPLSGDQYEVRFVTDKGAHLLRELTVPSQLKGQVGPGPERRFAMEPIQQFLDSGFEDPLWSEAALRCHGCAACAHQCPTCHCFDIVDHTSGDHGARVRNWDSCQQHMYSAHASGHNPRPAATQRQRNRVYHKYHTYPRKHGDFLCTGCGSCTRNCPVGLGMASILSQLSEPVQRQNQQQPSETVS